MHMFKVIVSYTVVVVCGAMVVAALADKKEFENRRDALHAQAINCRKTDYPIESIMIERWSPRAMSGKAVSDEELFTLFEAARWAASSFNAQPWRFVYAKRETQEWKTFFDWLVDFNKSWAQNAGALILVLSYKYFPHNHEFNPTHGFDTGAAWQNMALQASKMGLVAHGMGGFDYGRARKDLAISDDFDIHMMIAIGKPGDVSVLPAELRSREEPSIRNPIKSFAFEGCLKSNE